MVNFLISSIFAPWYRVHKICVCLYIYSYICFMQVMDFLQRLVEWKQTSLRLRARSRV